MECAKVPSGVRKMKKKQVKDEFDRQKQAEKKKRRLEKALATSAAIISELEKKKQKKQEEQRRLDEEGAAIAEAVALQVLLGEDADDSRKIMVENDEGFNPWDSACNIDFYFGRATALPHHSLSQNPLEGLGWVSDFHKYGCEWNELGNNNDWSASSETSGRNTGTPYFVEGDWDISDISVGLVAAQAVSSLQIAEDSHVNSVVFNRMLHG